MIDKVFPDITEAIADVHHGASIMVGGFGMAGTPYNLVKGLIEKGVKGLTLICNSHNNVVIMPDGSQVAKVIMSFPLSPFRGWMRNPFEEGITSGEIEVEIVPQGTLAERMRAGGAGIAGFYTPTGIGTIIEQGKEKREFEGKQYILERALKADFAFIKAYKADRRGNLVYRMASRNFNPIMATAAKVTVAEVEEIVETGALDPENVITPEVYVDRIVKAKPIEFSFKRRAQQEISSVSEGKKI